MPRLILGSQSPRRKEILSYFSFPFDQISPSFDEDSVPFEGDPKKYVLTISRGKALSLKGRFPEDILLTADTTVYQEGRIFGKPLNELEAFHFLSALVGRWHRVYTAVTLVYQNQEFSAVEETKVLFNSLTEDQIRHYHTKLHWADKAGGYAIQMAGGLIVHKIDGCYYNVMGLPINSVRELLLKVGIELWDYLK